MKKKAENKKVPDGFKFLNDFHQSAPQEVIECFEKFIKTVGINVGRNQGGFTFHSEWTGPYSETFATDLSFESGKAIIQLYKDLSKSFGASIGRARKEGKETGSKLLLQLHSGNITLQQLDNELKKGL